MTNKTAILALIIALAALAIVVLRPLGNGVQTAPEKKETVFERVMRTNSLHCGYAVYAPYLTRDPATGQLSGIWHDLTEVMADHLGIKVVWSDEVGLGDIGVALDTGRIDAFCGGLWTAGKRVRVVDFLNPSAYEPLLVYVRTDDHRFDNDLSLINDGAIRISAIDGEGGSLAAGEEFPKATMVSLQQMSSYADMYVQVVTNKADILLSAPSGAEEFMKNNPGVLRPIADKPVRMFPVAFGIKYGEEELRDMLNQAQADVIGNGAMNKILTKYEPFPGAFLRVAFPYADPQKKP